MAAYRIQEERLITGLIGSLRIETARDLFVGVMAVAIAVAVFGCIFNRANVLSYSIGYNLYGAERVLAGEIPYRDFHTLYPPATLYMNAAAFKLLGVSLYSAMVGVFAFKVLTILMVYLSGRLIMPRSVALAAALISIFWLRPNGAFKSVPMQYGSLLLAAALFFMPRYESRPKTIYLFLAGAALGVLTLFKHNIGAYALLGYFVLFVLERGTLKPGRNHDGKTLERALAITGGLALVMAPTILYMQAQGALGAMTRTLLLGPGEFLATRLVFPRSPVIPALFVMLLAVSAYASHMLRSRQVAATVLWTSCIILVCVSIWLADEPSINKLIFYVPLMVLAVAFVFSVSNRIVVTKRRAAFITMIFAAAAFLEMFPRFAREQSIGAMPFAILLTMYLLYLCRPVIKRFIGGTNPAMLALAVLPITFLLISARLFFNTYFESNLRFKSNTELNAERGRGVYFPESIAKKTDEIVSYIQQRVPANGYIFAQSNAGSPYLFLADRKNPSSAQFWGGVGVSSLIAPPRLKRLNADRSSS